MARMRPQDGVADMRESRVAVAESGRGYAFPVGADGMYYAIDAGGAGGCATTESMSIAVDGT